MVRQERSIDETRWKLLRFIPTFALPALFVGGVICALAPSARAQVVTGAPPDGTALRARLAPVMAPAGRPMPTDVVDLDAMLEKHDWPRLTARLRAAGTAQEAILDMNWEQSRLYGGAGFIIAYSYMYDLWRVGSALPGDRGAAMKQTAAMMLVYSLDLVAVDGVKCADVSAPGRRQDQVFAQNQPILAYLRTLPRPTRMQLGTISLGIEAATAALRKNDDVLCSGGLAEISAGLKAQGAKPLPQVPNAPGTIGKTYSVPTAPGYKPQFVSEDIWRAKQSEIRRSLPTSLTHLLTVPSDAPSHVPAK